MQRKKLFTSLALSLIIASTTTNYNVLAAQSGPRIVRLSGADRYTTSQAIVDNGWTSAETVIIANGEAFPDALGSAGIAKKYNAPVILTENGSTLSSIAMGEVTRLKPKNIILLGGTGVVSKAIEDSLKGSGYVVTRLSGQDRYETAVAIANTLGDVDSVVISNGDDFAGALSMAPIAGKKQIPILLVDKDILPSSAAAYLKAHNIKTTYVIGDSTIISDSVASNFTGVKRISGNTRYTINQGVLSEFENDMNFNTVIATSGEGFADALGGVSLSVKNSTPIVFVSNSDNSKTRALLKSEPVVKVDVLGGQGVLPDAKVNGLFDGSVTSVTP